MSGTRARARMTLGSWVAALVAVVGLVGVGACGDSGVSAPTDAGDRTDIGTVIVGVTTGLRVGTDFDRLRVVLRAGGGVIRDEVLPNGVAKLALPLELAFAGRPTGELVEVELTATSTAVKALHLSRIASTNVVGGKTLLLRVSLDSACVGVDVPGGPSPPLCGSTQTCVAGACANAHVNSLALEPYVSTWSQVGAPDRCRPANGGAPEVVVGQGQSDFLPLDDCSAASPAPAQIEAGPQGGHHIWLAARMRNLHQSGSITTVRGHFLDYAKDPGDMAVIFTYEPDEGGYCKLYGLRYQLDTGGIAIADVTGKKIEVSVEVKDADGTTSVGKRCVVLSKTVL